MPNPNTAVNNLTAALLDPILQQDPAGPRITYYDDASGERIELSALTLANWAAKTANLIRDEFGLLPGARICVLLPAHWQSAAVLLGCWWAGAEVLLTPADDADLAMVSADRLAEVEDVPEVAVLSLDAFGRPAEGLPVGVTDYATSVRVHGDQFRPDSGARSALDGLSIAEVLTAATDSAAAQSIDRTDRVLSSAGWDTSTELIEGLVAVLAAGASLVQVAHPADDAMARRMGTEKITIRR
ncbi:TIGR03089 family protein [Rhodococcus daqingensis]|uniref:TIGR03089 family protein n=1 Tax=Rhodococcus daqingensis TaxID=2479363 RepID=A0ABW2RUQ8_9NOCA